MFEKIENFDNVVEFLLLKAFFYKIESVIISNWKIMRNCCLPAFPCKLLVNYTGNIIHIKLNNCTIFSKQQKFLHGLNNLQTAICREIFSKHFFASIFVNFQKILAAHQKNVLKIFRKFTKKYPWGSLILVKLQAFTEAATGVVCKSRCSQKVACKINKKTPVPETLF